MTEMDMVLVVDADALSFAAAEQFVELARAAVLARGRFTVALSGGSTPRSLYQRLAAAPFRDRVDWSRVEVFWGDERGVPPDHPDSNFHMASTELLERVPIPPGRIHRMRAETADRDAAAREYQGEIARAFGVDEAGRPPSFDLVLLGMGSDGHTASLFPGGEALREGRRWAVSVEAPQRPPPSRITLTAPILNRAREIRVLVAGEDKAATLHAVLQGPHEPERRPVQLVSPENGRMVWLVDVAAASALEPVPAATRRRRTMTLLAGDVGGTKTQLALLEKNGGALSVAREAVVRSHDFPTFEAAVATFLAEATNVEIEAACFGVAGPVVDGRVKTTNLPWELDEERLASAIPARRVCLVNDLVAMGEGMLALPAASFQTIQSGERSAGTMALIAAGTGLGEAVLHWDGSRHVVLGSEGGHVDFAPRNDLEVGLLRFLRNEFGHASYERVLSGPGLHNIYRYLRSDGGPPEPAWLHDRLANGDSSAAISETALRGEDPVCVQALDLFVSIYGAEAGNLALKSLAVGGIIIGGGIGPKIRPKLANGVFLEAFRDKGRFSPLLSSIPVRLALDPKAPLLGAARIAASL